MLSAQAIDQRMKDKMPRVGLTIIFTDENGITRLASHEAETSYPVDNIRLDKRRESTPSPCSPLFHRPRQDKRICASAART